MFNENVDDVSQANDLKITKLNDQIYKYTKRNRELSGQFSFNVQGKKSTSNQMSLDTYWCSTGSNGEWLLEPEPTTTLAPAAPEPTTAAAVVEPTTLAPADPADPVDPADPADPVDPADPADGTDKLCFSPTAAECVPATQASVVSEVYNANASGGRKTELTAEATIAVGAVSHSDWTILVSFSQRVQNFDVPNFDSKLGLQLDYTRLDYS